MYKLIDFGNVWGIGFAINAMFVYFELSNYLNYFFEKHVLNLGSEELDNFFGNIDKRYILKKSIFRFQLGYDTWMIRLKFISIFNSSLSLFILIYCGFNPNAQFGFLIIIFTILLIFIPVIFIPLIIIHFFPSYRLEAYKRAITNIINKKENLSEEDKKICIENYFTVIDLINIPFPLPNHPCFKDDFMKRWIQLSKSELNKRRNVRKNSLNNEE